MTMESLHHCLDCEGEVSRRNFMSSAARTALAISAVPALQRVAGAAPPTPKSKAEGAVRRLYKSLTDDQRKVVALPLDDKRRTRINANWSITEANVGSFNKDQQETIKEIVKGITSEDGYDRFLKQMKADWGGIERYAVAIFGDPDKDQFEFELTGRHLTMRADGNTIPGAAFGGPIVYGHAAKGNSKSNLFWYQTQQANEVFKMLEGKQREKALLPRAPGESAVQLRKEGLKLPGIAVGDLATSQKTLVEKTLKAIFQPYRQEDIDEVMEVIKAGGGMDKVHIAFYRTGDLDDDGVWDVWRVEGPTLVCHFRGAPHVHAYINVAKRS